MRHTFQKIVIIIAICLVASFTGCQKDDSIAPEQSVDPGVKITKITFEEFKKNPKALREFEKVGGKDGLRPKSREYGDGYYYETEEVTLMEYSDSRYTYKSYIFPVYRDVPAQNIENLVIWEKSTGETNSYIFTYYLDESDIESILDGRQIFLGDKTLIRNVAKTDPDPYVVQAADGRCGVYSGTAPNDTDFFTQVYDGVTVYFDVVPCEQYEIDLSYVQDGGNNGGGGDNGGGTGNATPSIIVGYFPSGGSGSGGNPGGPNPGDPGSGGDYNPVAATPVLNPLWQGFVNSLSDEELDFLSSEAQLKFELRNLIPQSYPIRLFGEEIFDFAMDGHLEEALAILEYLNDGTPVTEEEIELVEEFMQQILTSGLDFDASRSLKSPTFIDLTSVQGNSPNEVKFRSIYDKLLQSSNFKNLFVNLFDQTPFINVKFVIGPTNQPSTMGQCQLFTNNGTLNNLITFKPELLENFSEVYISQTIIHEILHAYLCVKFRIPSIGLPIENINDMDLVECINLYYNNFSGPESQHNFFINHLAPTISNILSELKDVLITPVQQDRVNHPANHEDGVYLHSANNSVPPQQSANTTPWIWNDYFRYLSLYGLQNCDSFHSVYPVNSVDYYYFRQYFIWGEMAFKN